MTATEAAATIRRVEAQMIEEMTDAEFANYKSIPEEQRKMMLYMAFKMANA